MDVKYISTLANLLRDSGDKILSSEFKLTLSGSLLKEINESFTLITRNSCKNSKNETEFKVAVTLNSKSNLLEDLQLVSDFVQKTLSLCIINVPEEENFTDIINLNEFHSLTKLEIQKLNINQIVGLQKLRPQLQHLICIRCLKSVDDVIINCGKDNANGFDWKELRIADFSYNNLKKCDTSLEFVTYLQNLNLSHNHLTSVEAIKWLPHLKVLNLSYNRLNFIPIFHLHAYRSLKVLLMHNNMIESIDIFKLEALTDFDLSNNLLLDHSNLLPLSTFRSLSNLNLSGNPLYYHAKHRENTAKYLYRNTKRQNFILDCEPLSKYEKSLIGQIKSFNSLYSTRSLTHINRTSGSSTPIGFSKRDECSSISSCVGSLQEEGFSGTIQEKNISLIKNTENEEEKEEDVVLIKMKLELGNLEKEYLELKTKVEDMRKEYGINWLQEQSSKEILGVEPTSKSESEKKIKPEDLINEFFDSIVISKKNSNDAINDTFLTSTPINSNLSLNSVTGFSDNILKINNSKESVNLESMKINETVYESTNENSDNTENLIFESFIDDSVPKLDQLYSNISIEEEQLSEPEDQETFLVYINDSTDEVLVTVSDTKIKEKDALTQRTLARWNLKILESCERIKNDTLLINFDTINVDRKERIYKLTEERCHYLESYLRDILSKRDISEMNQIVYRCVQCLCQFTLEKSNKYKKIDTVVQCPGCQGKFVAEVNENPTNILSISANKTPPLKSSVKSFSDKIIFQLQKQEEFSFKILNEPQISNAKQIKDSQQLENQQVTQYDKNVLEQSSSHSSIGKGIVWKQSNKPLSSAGSLNESSSCSKISQNSFDSNQSVAGSSSNDRDNDFNSMGGISNNSKYYNDSEVEILSNPSQSSIEVLDAFQSSRKTSEERRISRIPSLETIEDNSIRNFSFKFGEDITTEDLISGFGILNDNNKTITSNDSTADFLKKEIKQNIIENQLKQQEKKQLQLKAKDENEQVCCDESEQIEKVMKPIKGIIEKKISSGHLNLTESSSSGSVTDSICTTYEQDNKKSNDALDSINIENQENDKNKSVISNIIGEFFFQSTNKLLSKSPSMPDSQLTNNGCAKFKYNYTDFSDIDHRLKFFLILKKFNQNENFKWLLKCKVFNGNSLRFYEALVIMSTNKLYILEIIGPENDDPSQWLKDEISVSSDRIEMLQLLPFKTGLSLTIRNYSEHFLLILQDILRTDSLMLFFAENPLPNNCILEYRVSEIVMKNLLSLTNNNNSKIKMFTILNSCEHKMAENEIQITSPSAFYITDDYLYLTKSNLSWLSENLDKIIEFSSVKKMCNLIEVKKLENNILEIYFTDEIDSHTWKCEFGTPENTETFLNAIEQSWEKIFGVPLLNNYLNN